MNGIVIITKADSDLKLFQELANKTGATIQTLTDDEMLDFGLLKAMEEGRETDFVPKDRIMKKLRINGNKIS